jgi:hypothetical protein
LLEAQVPAGAYRLLNNLSGMERLAKTLILTTRRVRMSPPSGSSSAADKIEVPKHDHYGTVPGREFEGRPQLLSIIEEEAQIVREGQQSLSVFVCGPTTMQNDVRNAVASENLNILRGSISASSVYLHSEHFSWA